MMTFIQRWSIAASVALALALAVAAQTQQTGSSTSSVSRPAQTHHRKSSRRHYSRRMHLPKGPTPDRISQIQSALARGGYYQGDPNGKWDANTIEATERFQSANGLDSTGKLDAPTLQKLGLGSDIAGVSAPKPVVPKCCAVPSTSTSPPPASKPASVSAGLPAQGSAALSNGAAAPSTASTASDTATGSDPKPPQH